MDTTKRHKPIVLVFPVFQGWLTIFTFFVFFVFSTFFTSNCFAKVSDADNSFLVNSKSDKTPQKMEEMKEMKEAKGGKPIFVDPIPRVDRVNIVEMYKELHPNTSNFDTQKEQKENDEFEKNLQRNRKEFEASLQKEQEFTEEIHRQTERQKEELKQLEQHRTGSIFDLIGEAFNAIIGFFTLVIFAVFFVFLIFLIKPTVKQHRRYKEQMMSSEPDFNLSHDKYNVDQPQSNVHKNGSKNYEVSHRRDESGCYGINPATGLPLRSSGTDVAGNPLGPSNHSSCSDIFSHNSTMGSSIVTNNYSDIQAPINNDQNHL